MNIPLTPEVIAAAQELIDACRVPNPVVKISRDEINVLSDAFEALMMQRSSYDQEEGTDGELLDKAEAILTTLKLS